MSVSLHHRPLQLLEKIQDDGSRSVLAARLSNLVGDLHSSHPELLQPSPSRYDLGFARAFPVLFPTDERSHAVYRS